MNGMFWQINRNIQVATTSETNLNKYYPFP